MAVKELVERSEELDKLKASLDSPLISEARRARQQLAGKKQKGKGQRGGKKQRKPK